MYSSLIQHVMARKGDRIIPALAAAAVLLTLAGFWPVQAQTRAVPSLPRAYLHTNYPLDTLRRLVKNAQVPDTTRIFYLTRLAVAIGATDLAKAAEYAQQAVAHARTINYITGQIQGLCVLGSTRTDMGDYVAAIAAYQSALNLAQASGHHQALITLYRHMGNVNSTTGDHERALRFLLKGYQVLQDQCPQITPECLENYSLYYTSIGNTYFQQKAYQPAKLYALQALQLYDRSSIEPGAAKANLLLGRIYQAQLPHTQGRLDSAGFYLQAALYIQASKENENEVAGNLISLAELYQQEHKYRDMYQVALRSLKMAQKVGSLPFERDAASLAAKACGALGNYQDAFAFQTRAENLNARLVDEEKARALEQLQVRYEMKVQQQRISSLTQQAKADAAAARQQRRWYLMLVVFCGMLIICGLIGGVLFIRLRKRRHELAHANQELALANDEISQSILEKEVLVQEIHHRVKNNLQLVSSLLSWQRDTLPEPALVRVLDGNRARIQSMAMVHEFLYQADNMASVRLDIYLKALLDSLHSSLASPGKEIKLQTSLAPVLMDAKEAGHFGLLVNEVVTNAYKHAYTNQNKGHLAVELVREGEGFSLSISDDGKGLPETGYVSRTNSIGIKLVRTLTKQLKAKINIHPQPVGTRVEITRQY